MVVGWLDNWHPLCVLLDRFGYRAVYDSHSWLNAKQCIIGLPRVTACWLGDSKETLVVCFAEAVQKALAIFFFFLVVLAPEFGKPAFKDVTFGTLLLDGMMCWLKVVRSAWKDKSMMGTICRLSFSATV
jgi:hypothetical protein